MNYKYVKRLIMLYNLELSVSLTLQSSLKDDERPCEMPAAITDPEWIIGPSCKTIKHPFLKGILNKNVTIQKKDNICV